MPQQIDCEARRAWRTGFQRQRGKRTHAPAAHRGARMRFGGRPDQKNADAGLCGGMRQPPRRRQVEDFRRAPDLDDDRAEGGAAQRLVSGAQCRQCIGRADKEHGFGIAPEFQQPDRVQLALIMRGHILAHPDDLAAPFSRPQRQTQPESAGRRAVAAADCKNLMQRGARQSTVEGAVDLRQPQCERVRRGRPAPLCFNPGKAPPQPGKTLFLHGLDLMCSLFVLVKRCRPQESTREKNRP